jgi:LysM repeat protein
MVRASVPQSDPAPPVPATGAVCPYLLSADGGWRASTPARDHRCTAVAPAALLAPDKQRRLCLAADHTGCATFRAAAHAPVGAPDGLDDDRANRGQRRLARPLARTTPLVLDHGRVAVTVPGLHGERGVGQLALIAMMGLAFAAILFARLTSGGDAGAGPGVFVVAASPTASPGATRPAGSPAPAAGPTDAPSRTLVPTEVQPTPAPATAPPAPTVAPSAAASTYKVRSGDTLSGIAAEFDTTWQVLAELNGIEDPGRLKVGQVLQLP